jgi:succinate dehydrogenase / fumarate reductase flavoprotein subunit
MDYRAVPSQTWEWEDFKHALAVSPVLKERPVRISPGAHFFMGGARIRDDAGTDLAGLFACGEAASGVHGANRRGGNALTECMVFGKIAGTQAAAYAHKNKSRLPSPSLSEINTKSLSLKHSAIDLQDIKHQIQTIAWQYAGIIRSEEGLNIGLSRIEEIDQKLAGAFYNSAIERRHLENLKSAAFTLKAVIHASLGRKESRGAFRRSDFPSEDKDYQKNSCLTYRREENTFSVEQYPI